MYPNTLKIHMVCVTYTTNIFLPTLLVILFIYVILFKKTEIRVKPGHLQQIKKMMGLSFSVKLHLYLTGNTL